MLTAFDWPTVSHVPAVGSSLSSSVFLYKAQIKINFSSLNWGKGLIYKIEPLFAMIVPSHLLYSVLSHIFIGLKDFTVSFLPHWFLCGMISSLPICCISANLHGICVASFWKTETAQSTLRFALMLLRCEMWHAQSFETSLTHLQACSYQSATEAIYYIKGRALFVRVTAVMEAELLWFVQRWGLIRIWLDQAQSEGQR